MNTAVIHKGVDKLTLFTIYTLRCIRFEIVATSYIRSITNLHSAQGKRILKTSTAKSDEVRVFECCSIAASLRTQNPIT